MPRGRPRGARGSVKLDADLKDAERAGGLRPASRAREEVKGDVVVHVPPRGGGMMRADPAWNLPPASFFR